MSVAFINIEKTYDRVPRKILKWALMKKELSKVYVNVIQEMYKSTNTKIISFYGEIEDFTVTV